MDIQDQEFRYMEWKTPEEMHFSSLQWISELEYIQDEHKFFEDMLKQYTLPIIESHRFDEVKNLTFQLSDSEKQLDALIEKTRKHRNGLQILVDGKDQPEEEKKYRADHRELHKEISAYTKNYRVFKKTIFQIFSSTLKQQKKLLG